MVQVFSLFLFINTLFAESPYAFSGKHFIASYLECDQEALENLISLEAAMDKAVTLSGATILTSAKHIFEPNGITLMYLLSESHASLHSYPECQACFVDLFTCGDHCFPEPFDAAMQAYLKPKKTSIRLFDRHEEVEERSYFP